MPRIKTLELLNAGDQQAALERDHRASMIIGKLACDILELESAPVERTVVKRRQVALYERIKRLTKYRKQFWTPERLHRWSSGEPL